MYTTLLLRHYSNTGNYQWSGSYTDYYAARPRTKESLGDSNDTASFWIQNFNNQDINTFGEQDKIEVYLLINGATPASGNLVFNGVLKTTEVVFNGRKRNLVLTCKSFNEIATQAVTFYSTTGANVMEFLEGALNSVRNISGAFSVGWDSNNPTYQNSTASNLAGNASTPFPDLNSGGTVQEYYKSLNKIIEDYLIPENTGDGRYYWYIDTTPNLVIRKRLSSVTANWNEGTDFFSPVYKYNTDDVKNFVIVKCGTDPNNVGITTVAQDPISMAKNGLRYYMLVDRNIAANLIAKEKAANSGSFNDDNLFPSSYPYSITTWGSSLSVSNANEWVDAIRSEARRVGRNRGENYIALKSKGTKQLTVDTLPTVSYSIGDVINVTSASLGLTNQKLRIKEIFHNGRTTTFTLEEDATQ